jgi:phospholipase C
MITRIQAICGTFLALGGCVTLSTHNAAQIDDTTTPIKHLVVIYQENVSFDHYFATYPYAANPPGEPRFDAAPNTPAVNGLNTVFLHGNPNATKPFRLSRAQAATCDMDHAYTAEQKAAHSGLMDKFVEFAGPARGCDRNQVMGYFDGNTVTALWQYAQHFAMSDNSYGSTYGPSTVGALNLIAGQTAGANVNALVSSSGSTEYLVASGTVIGDVQPQYDDCSTHEVVGMTGRNVGDLLNLKAISWGFFSGGFRPSARDGQGKAVCRNSHTGSDGKKKGDYIPHHQPFQYYPSTANPRHLPPSSTTMIGRQDQANHQYDLEDFWVAAQAGNLPAVSYIKAPAYQDGHAGYSDPLAEQAFLVSTLNRLQQLKDWQSMAIIIAYDDSDGWYDHVMPPIVNPSNLPESDALTGPGHCGEAKPGAYPGRCGYGPRLPLLVISPYAKRNFVDHSITDQSSILRFIEDNWRLGRIGDQSFDERAGSLLNLFDFKHGPDTTRVLLESQYPQDSGRR